MSYAVFLTNRAVRELRDLPKDIIARADSHIMALAEDPRPPGCKKLKTKSPEGWRIRVGDYRILYQIDDPNHKVTVYRIGHRRDIYD